MLVAFCCFLAGNMCDLEVLSSGLRKYDGKCQNFCTAAGKEINESLGELTVDHRRTTPKL